MNNILNEIRHEFDENLDVNEISKVKTDLKKFVAEIDLKLKCLEAKASIDLCHIKIVSYKKKSHTSIVK